MGQRERFFLERSRLDRTVDDAEALGPVLERLHNELLSPLIDRTFERCAEAGMNDHLAKPITAASLYATVLRWLRDGSAAAAAVRRNCG